MMAHAATAQDARFEDADEIPLRLRAESDEDLAVMAALLQDAVGKVGDAAFLKKKRRFVALVNRFRWEDAVAAERAGRPYERVRAAINIENVSHVRARGVATTESETVYSLLSLAFEPGEDGAGVVRLLLSGGAEIAAEVEALSLCVEDVSRPWTAKGTPGHGLD